MGSPSDMGGDFARSQPSPARLAAEAAQEQAYAGLGAARAACGVARIVMGVHLATLHDSGGWRGRTGAKSFRRFLQEDGIEPRAAYQYMEVARAFVLEHGVAPERIALAGMRVLVEAARHLRPDDPSKGTGSNVDEVVALVTSMPAAEAQEALRERFGQAPSGTPAGRLAAPVYRILDGVDKLTHEQRAELYQALRAGPAPLQRSPASSDISDTTKA